MNTITEQNLIVSEQLVLPAGTPQRPGAKLVTERGEAGLHMPDDATLAISVGGRTAATFTAGHARFTGVKVDRQIGVDFDGAAQVSVDAGYHNDDPHVAVTVGEVQTLIPNESIATERALDAKITELSGRFDAALAKDGRAALEAAKKLEARVEALESRGATTAPAGPPEARVAGTPEYLTVKSVGEFAISDGEDIARAKHVKGSASHEHPGESGLTLEASTSVMWTGATPQPPGLAVVALGGEDNALGRLIRIPRGGLYAVALTITLNNTSTISVESGVHAVVYADAAGRYAGSATGEGKNWTAECDGPSPISSYAFHRTVGRGRATHAINFVYDTSATGSNADRYVGCAATHDQAQGAENALVLVAHASLAQIWRVTAP